MACNEDSELNPHAHLFLIADVVLSILLWLLVDVEILFRRSKQEHVHSIFCISICILYLRHFKWVELKTATYTYCLISFLMVTSTFDNYSAFCPILFLLMNFKYTITHWNSKFQNFQFCEGKWESTRSKRQSYWIFWLQEVKFCGSTGSALKKPVESAVYR